MFTKTKTKQRSSRFWLVLGIITIVALLTQMSVFMPAYGQGGETVTVDFALNGGTPTYRASGFIYGLSPDASTPPTTYLTQINTRFIRAGGSQVGCPNGGWVNGHYSERWDFMEAYYAKTQEIGATLIMILAPLWGSDGVCNVPRWPGDNGNWTEFDNFLTQVINDAQANGMTGPNVRWDIWNEPDIFFWGASQSQYLQMWGRAVNRIRAELPNAVIEGPSMSADPDTNNSWWNAYLNYIAANNVAPDIISWHSLPGDPVDGANIMNSMLSSRGISVDGYSVNEYGAFGNEQQPGPSAWYIARLERANGGVDGARANWGMVGETPSLHDTLGWLVTAAPANQPMGQWWVYKRYADQTGVRTNITPGASVDGVVFQDSAAQRSITLLGKNGGGSGTVTVQFNNVPSFLIANGSTNVLVERMPSTNAYVSAPTVVSNGPMTVSGSSLTVNINWSNALDAYAITLTPGSGGATPTPTPTSQPPQQDPVVWYQFDQSSGTTATDSSGNGQHATLVNGPTWVGGAIGNAVNLDGSNDYVSMPTGVVSTLNDFTIATWVNLDSISSWSRIFDFGAGTSVNMFLTPQNGATNAVRFAITTSGAGGEQQITGSSALPTGTWTHVAVTKSGNTGTLYVNGSVVGTNNSISLSPSSLGNTNQNWIGQSQYSADPNLDGQIDDFRIYNRALSGSEVDDLASGGGGPTPTPTNTPVGPTNTPTPTPTNTPTPSGSSEPISQSNWSLQFVDSEELSGEDGAATNAFDGNSGTIWHTEWSSSDPPHPHEIQINLGASYNVDGFRYLPRQDGNANGRISQYQFYVSTNPSNWGSAVATGTFANNSSEKEVTFTAKTGQYVRLVALSEVNGNPWTSAAEINVLGTSAGGPTPTNTPVSSSTYQAEDASVGGGATVDTNHTGYNGSGFVNFPTNGGFVEYQNVDGGSGGSRTLQFRFALGASSARTGNLVVNGSSQNITFQPTGAWNAWEVQNVVVNLNGGTNNTIRLESTGQDLANQDQMTVN